MEASLIVFSHKLHVTHLERVTMIAKLQGTSMLDVVGWKCYIEEMLLGNVVRILLGGMLHRGNVVRKCCSDIVRGNVARVLMLALRAAYLNAVYLRPPFKTKNGPSLFFYKVKGR